MIMGRPKKDSKPLCVNLDIAIYEQLERFCKETGMPKTTAIERILERQFTEYFNKPEKERNIIN